MVAAAEKPPLSASESAALRRRKRPPAHKLDRTSELNPNRPVSRQEARFAVLVAQGWPLHRCYTEATGAKVAKKNHAANQAWKWRLRPAVEAEITRRRAALDEAEALSRVEKRTILASIARTDTLPALARIGAVQVDNRMTGHDEPVRVSVTHELVFSVDPIRDMRRADRIEVPNTQPALPAAPASAENAPLGQR